MQSIVAMQTTTQTTTMTVPATTRPRGRIRGLFVGSGLKSNDSRRRNRRNRSRSSSSPSSSSWSSWPSFRGAFGIGLFGIVLLLLLFRSFHSLSFVRRNDDNSNNNRSKRSAKREDEYNNNANVTATASSSSSSSSSSSIDTTGNSFTGTSSSTSTRNNKIIDNSRNVLFLIFCGGPSGPADLHAILETWGRTITKVLIMTNTPDSLRPVLASSSLLSTQSSSSVGGGEERERYSNEEEETTISSSSSMTTSRKEGYWKIYTTSTMDGGGKRRPFQSWQEIVQELDRVLKDDPSIQYVVRSDSDTWWNTRLLFNQLSTSSMSSLSLSSSSRKRHRHRQEPIQFGTSSPSSKRSNHSRHQTKILPRPDEPYMVGQFHPLVDFRWERNISGREMNGLHKYNGVITSNGRDAYLTGGAGVIFTHESLQRLVSCFSNTSSITTMTDTGFMTAASSAIDSNPNLRDHRRRRRRLRSANDQEDVWSSRMAYVCNVTLKRHDGMYQSGRKFWKVPTSLSIHRAVGDGRKGYVHPRYYETILLLLRTIWNTTTRWLIGCIFVGLLVIVAFIIHPKILNKRISRPELV